MRRFLSSSIEWSREVDMMKFNMLQDFLECFSIYCYINLGDDAIDKKIQE